MNVVSLIDWLGADVVEAYGGYHIILRGRRKLHVRHASAGRGICRGELVESRYGWTVGGGFTMEGESEADLSVQGGSDGTTLEIRMPSAFPAEGFVDRTLSSYIVAPSVKLDVPLQRDIALMLLTPQGSPQRVTGQDERLDITYMESSAHARLRYGDSLQCDLSCDGNDFKSVQLRLRRSPPAYHEGIGLSRLRGYVQMEHLLASLEAPGSTEVSWGPSLPKWNETLWILHPFLNQNGFRRLLEGQGVSTQGMSPQRPEPIPTNEGFVFGDGGAMEYQLELWMDPKEMIARGPKSITLLQVSAAEGTPPG